MTSHAPNREELRRRRLAVFAQRSHDDDENEKPPAAVNQKPIKSIETANKREIVDLMDSSDDEEEKQQPRKRKTTATQMISTQKNKTDSKKAEEVDLWNSSDDDEAKRTKAAATSRTAKKTVKESKKPKSTKSSTAMASSNDIQSTFQVASYNLWFGPDRNGSPHEQARMQAVAGLLLAQPNLYFAALQEVVHSLDDALFPLLESTGYRIIRQPLGHPLFSPYGVALAVHASLAVLDSGWKPYTGCTMMDRGFVYARCRVPNDGLVCLVTSTHLESWAGKDMNGSAARAPQLNRMEEFCNQHLEQGQADVAIMMGDMNWDDASRNPTDDAMDDVLMSVEWKDAWLETNHLRTTVDAKKGYTYDAKLNPMLGGSMRRRFDRCLVRSARHVPTHIVSTTLVGKEALPGLTFDKENPYTKATKTTLTAPSDHFGLVTELRASSTGSSGT